MNRRRLKRSRQRDAVSTAVAIYEGGGKCRSQRNGVISITRTTSKSTCRVTAVDGCTVGDAGCDRVSPSVSREVCTGNGGSAEYERVITNTAVEGGAISSNRTR